MAVSSSISHTHVSSASRFWRKVSESVDPSRSANVDLVPFGKIIVKKNMPCCEGKELRLMTSGRKKPDMFYGFNTRMIE